MKQLSEKLRPAGSQLKSTLVDLAYIKWSLRAEIQASANIENRGEIKGEEKERT